MSDDDLARNLRSGSPPIFTRIQQGAVLLDFRTIQPDEDAAVENALRNLLSTRRET
jgi:hypothetical protein